MGTSIERPVDHLIAQLEAASSLLQALEPGQGYEFKLLSPDGFEMVIVNIRSREEDDSSPEIRFRTVMRSVDTIKHFVHGFLWGVRSAVEVEGMMGLYSEANRAKQTLTDTMTDLIMLEPS